jgi:hypothetical protein
MFGQSGSRHVQSLGSHSDGAERILGSRAVGA